jgi:hypothetical protein
MHARSLPQLIGRECEKRWSELECEVVALFDEYRDRLLAFVRAFSLRGYDAEEVAQEVFLSLFRHLIAGKPRNNLRGWIFRVAHNLALIESCINNAIIDAEGFNPYAQTEGKRRSS